MKPRFCLSPLGVSDAVNSAWRTYTRLYDAPDETEQRALRIMVRGRQSGAVQGRTDADGSYRFDLTLPAYFAGKPLDHGAARVLVEASVKDSAGHAESRGEPIAVSESPLILTAVPEGGTLVPGSRREGPLLVTEPSTTVVVPPGVTLHTTPSGNYVLELR